MAAASFINKKREILPLVPLRDMVVFPHMMAPFIVGRESSVRALEQALAGPTKRIFLSAQKDPRIDDPLRDDICDMGVIATVIQNLKLPNGNVRVMVEGVQRGKIVSVSETDGALGCEVETYEVTLQYGPWIDFDVIAVATIEETFPGVLSVYG